MKTTNFILIALLLMIIPLSEAHILDVPAYLDVNETETIRLIQNSDGGIVAYENATFTLGNSTVNMTKSSDNTYFSIGITSATIPSSFATSTALKMSITCQMRDIAHTMFDTMKMPIPRWGSIDQLGPELPSEGIDLTIDIMIMAAPDTIPAEPAMSAIRKGVPFCPT